MWPYQALKNWGHSDQTFILNFVDTTYPIKTNQGKWMRSLVDFHVNAIVSNKVRPLFLACCSC